jgi:membrane protein YdbS with pleckstrin-like domain
MKATYLGPEENFLWEGRPSGWLYFPGPILLLIIVLAGNLYLWARLPGSPLASIIPAFSFMGSYLNAGVSVHSLRIILGLVLLLVAIIFLAERWFRRATTVFAVTNTRLIRQKGIFSKDFDEIQLRQIRGIDVKQGIGQRILGYGTVKLSAEAGGSGAMGNEEWKGFPSPVKFQRMVESAQESLSGVGRN